MPFGGRLLFSTPNIGVKGFVFFKSVIDYTVNFALKIRKSIYFSLRLSKMRVFGPCTFKLDDKFKSVGKIFFQVPTS